MIIGLDLDNTIVSYENVFPKIAEQQKLVPEGSCQSKIAVRDFLRQHDREAEWTELQGYVYGKCMDSADVFPQVLETLHAWSSQGFSFYILSHKTQFPCAGPAFDLHATAREWIAKTFAELKKSLPESHIHFFPSKEDKISAIKQYQCDVFVDDLPEILMADHFPTDCKPVLFDPANKHCDSELPHVNEWRKLATLVPELAQQQPPA